MANRRLLIFEDRTRLTDYLLRHWLRRARAAIRLRGSFQTALAADPEAVEFYCRLSGQDAFEGWGRTHVFWTDERRAVADGDPSHYGFLKEHFLNYIPIPLENIHPIPHRCDSAREGAMAYERHLRDHFQLDDSEYPSLDWILLGMDTDGRIAALFPGAVDRQTTALAAGIMLTTTDAFRITLTLPVLNHAREIVILATGSEKAPVLREVFHGRQAYPAAHVRPVDGDVLYLVDRRAAGRLGDYGNHYYHEDEAVVVPLVNTDF